MNLSSIDRDNLTREFNDLKRRLAIIEAYMQGRKIPSLRVGRIGVDKLKAGHFSSDTYIIINDTIVDRIILGRGAL